MLIEHPRRSSAEGAEGKRFALMTMRRLYPEWCRDGEREGIFSLAVDISNRSLKVRGATDFRMNHGDFGNQKFLKQATVCLKIQY